MTYASGERSFDPDSLGASRQVAGKHHAINLLRFPLAVRHRRGGNGYLQICLGGGPPRETDGPVFFAQRGSYVEVSMQAVLLAPCRMCLCPESHSLIQAVYENMDLKKKIFATLDKVCKPGMILHFELSVHGVQLEQLDSETWRRCSMSLLSGSQSTMRHRQHFGLQHKLPQHRRDCKCHQETAGPEQKLPAHIRLCT